MQAVIVAGRAEPSAYPAIVVFVALASAVLVSPVASATLHGARVSSPSVAEALDSAPSPDSSFRSRPGDPQAWQMLALAAAWSARLRRDSTDQRLEATMLWPSWNGDPCADTLRLRYARTRDGKFFMEAVHLWVPIGARVRFDGHSTVSRSIGGGIWMQSDTSHRDLGGESLGFMLTVLHLIGLPGEAASYPEGARARLLAPEDLEARAHVVRCDRVEVRRVVADTTRERAVYWLDRATHFPWLMRAEWLEPGGRRSTSELRYQVVQVDVPPPDSLFDTTLPPGAATIADTTDLESTRPRGRTDRSAAPAPSMGPDGTTFRWVGEARSVALMGSFNCWDPRPTRCVGRATARGL